MQNDLEAMKPVLAASQLDTAKLMEEVESQLPGVEAKRAAVLKDKAIAQADADECNRQKESVEADLAQALPALQAAVRALDTIKQSEINEVKALAKPPQGVKVMRVCVCYYYITNVCVVHIVVK
jgi:dynein heavy chain, axonemal